MTPAEEHPLDNGVWHALTSRCAPLARRHGDAAVFDPEVAVFAGLAARTPAAWADLARLTPGTALFGADLVVGDGWTETRRLRCLQMLQTDPLDAGPDGSSDGSLIALTDADVEDMTTLVALTQPGPFAARTIELGGYLGVRDDDRLIAMAGRRVQLDHPTDPGAGGFVEVSAVCVDPAYRGRRLAGLVTAAVATGIRADGDTPYLHVMEDNLGAIRLYERLGFRTRVTLEVAVVERAPA